MVTILERTKERLTFLSRRLDHRQRGTRCVFAALLLFLVWFLYLYLDRRDEAAGSKYIDAMLVGLQRCAGNKADPTKDCDRFEDIQALPIKNERLLRYIRDQMLIPPSTLEYRLPRTEESAVSSQELEKLFRNKDKGFFIECGANDGTFLSNTLALERTRNWSGLLVEAHPKFRETLLKLHRKAWFANVCLSPYNNISKINFVESDTYKRPWQDVMAKLDMSDDPTWKKGLNWGFRDFGSVPCFPVVSLLAAMDVTHVDFFSLDVEGVELKILETLPFDDSLTIDVFQVGNTHLPEGKEALKTFMLSKGYELVTEKGFDYIFKASDIRITKVF